MMISMVAGANEPSARLPDRQHVLIVGGGISGLSAAWYLQQQARQHAMNIQYTLLEASDRWGGKILTEQVESDSDVPFVVEAGPDSFLTQKPWALQLARELGLAERFLGTNDQMRTVYVLHQGKPVALPEGVLLIVPTQFLPIALSPLISPLGKLRMGLDFLIPAKRDDADETLAEFVRRRLGNEALDKIAEPLMSGIYNAEAEKQSIMATFPRFRQLEREHGSLIRGMLASRRQRAVSASDTKTSMFMSLQGGTQELVEALVQQLKGNLRLNTSVSGIEYLTESRYRVTIGSGDTLHADAVLLTIPAYTTAHLLRSLAPDAADKLDTIRYVSTGTISLAFRAADIKRRLQGFGLVIPKGEQRPINAITISSTKFDHRAPKGWVLLRVFFGGSRSPETMTYNDSRLLDVVRRELQDILGIEAAPLFQRIYRWHRANPQYDLNHLEHIAAIEAVLPVGIYATGSAFRGVGMPDCVHQSQQTVNKIVEQLKQATVAKAEGMK
jgi:oxygen-dependent protoporphyrinogen oxidase